MDPPREGLDWTQGCASACLMNALTFLPILLVSNLHGGLVKGGIFWNDESIPAKGDVTE